jgi:hypothetical protein
MNYPYSLFFEKKERTLKIYLDRYLATQKIFDWLLTTDKSIGFGGFVIYL